VDPLNHVATTIADRSYVGRIGRPRQEGEEIELRRTCTLAALAVVLAGVPTPATLAAVPPPVTTPSVQIEVVQPGGFHWQDAAVGSLAAIGLTFVVGGVVLAARRRDGRPSRSQPPPTT
jgi:hypothetical protein